MRETHVKNHYVPEFYLKRWANENQEVNVYRVVVSNSNVPIWRPYSTAAIGYHKHLYTQIINGKESDELENWFNKEYENPASTVLNRATNDQRLTRNDWSVLIRYLAAQDVRTPSRLLDHLKRAPEFSNMIIEVLESLKSDLEKGEIISKKVTSDHNVIKKTLPIKVITEMDPEKDLATIRVESYVGRSTWIHSIKHLLENTAKILLKHKWSIVKPAVGYTWPTSDNPVVKLNFIDKNNYDLQGGWGRLNGNIIFPIGPEHALFVEIGQKPFKKGVRLSVKNTIFFRKIIAENSHRLIFSKHQDEAILSIKPRIVDNQIIQQEKQALANWHERNSELELEYLS